ncbi:MAG TPA: tetratricopeptide repeat protein, partial [Candidatus Krumholzibacterium sp.]|nr:tetratricopeptide repeat protein [Candidatus Krumholzibacterium sp.]
MLAALLLLAHLVNMTVAVDTPALEAGNLVRLGKVHARRGEQSEAREAFDEALRVEPGNKAALDALERLDSRK